MQHRCLSNTDILTCRIHIIYIYVYVCHIYSIYIIVYLANAIYIYIQNKTYIYYKYKGGKKINKEIL